MNSNNVRQTYKEQLFTGFTLVLWAVALLLLLIGIAGTVADLSDPFIGNQGLTRGDATGFLIGGLVLVGAVMAGTWFGPEYKRRRNLPA